MNIDLGNATEKVFDNFKKVTPLLLTIALISGLILFLPDSILSKMALNNLPAAWRVIIGLLFLLSSVLTIVICLRSVIRPLMNKFFLNQFRKRMRKRFIQLSKDKKEMVCELVKNASDPIELDSSLGIVRYLESQKFITKAQNIGTFDVYSNGVMFPYCAQAWVMDLYDNEPELFE